MSTKLNRDDVIQNTVYDVYENYDESKSTVDEIILPERDKDKDFRRRFITELINDNHNKPYVLELKRALEYFNIPEQEWIDYGGTTLFMHNINKNYLIEKFGYKL